ATVRRSQRSRLKRESCDDAAREADTEAPVPRQCHLLRRRRGCLRSDRRRHRRGRDRRDPDRARVLPDRYRLRLVEVPPAAKARGGARVAVTAVDTLEQAVESLCGDLAGIRAPRGTELNAKSWSTEAPLRMLLNNLDPEVAERPKELVVYGGSG